jgi:uncharacterized protein YbjT (DUF2867 family)
LKILVAGGTGFIGRRLIKRLLDEDFSRQTHMAAGQDGEKREIICLTRNLASAKRLFEGLDVRVVEADVAKYDDLAKVMSEGIIDVAYYLVHSMEGSSKQWKGFSERDRIAARNFADAATAHNVRRIIYLGGLISEKNGELSEHMKSRKQVGEILQTSSAKVTIFRAAVILGHGGGSFEMLRYLVERLPVMVCPKWVLTKSQPIGVDDVVEYLARAIESEETKGRTFDIGGPDVLTYAEMMKRYATITGNSIRIMILPFLTPRLSSYWIDLITPISASLARPLIDSLKHEATIQDDSIKKILQVKTQSFEQAIQVAIDESKQSVGKRQRPAGTNSSGKKYLLASLIAISILSATFYFYPDDNAILSISSTGWIILHGTWYLGILAAIYFIRKDTRLGALTGGVIGWTALGFFLANLFYPLMHSLSADLPVAGTVRYFAGVALSAFTVVLSHKLFHGR